MRTKEQILQEDFGITAFNDLCPFTSRTESMDTYAREILIDFKQWYDKLTPADKCTVHPSGGSGMIGLYNMQDEDLIEKYLQEKKPKHENKN